MPCCDGARTAQTAASFVCRITAASKCCFSDNIPGTFGQNFLAVTKLTLHALLKLMLPFLKGCSATLRHCILKRQSGQLGKDLLNLVELSMQVLLRLLLQQGHLNLAMLRMQMPLRLLLPFLEGAVRGLVEQARNAAVVCSLRRSENLHLREDLTQCKQRQVSTHNAHLSPSQLKLSHILA